MGLYNISVNQGESFDLVATITNSAGSAINLSGYNVRGSAKYSYGATGSALINLNPSITNSISGIIAINLTSTQTSSLPVTTAVYDVERYSTGDASVIKVLNGSFTINPEVTT
jgi:hypothetical protein